MRSDSRTYRGWEERFAIAEANHQKELERAKAVNRTWLSSIEGVLERDGCFQLSKHDIKRLEEIRQQLQ